MGMGLDFGSMWAATQGSLPKTWDTWVDLFLHVLQNPWTRGIALIVLVSAPAGMGVMRCRCLTS